MDVNRSIKDKKSVSGFFVGLIFFVAFFIVSKCISVSYSIEDSQQVIFPVLIVAFYFLLRKSRIKIPAFIFITTFLIWIFLLFRVSLMINLGYFEGRVIIGRLADDKYGFEARELYKSLQKIALTYHLPGPALLPIANAYKSDADSRFVAKNSVFGHFNFSGSGTPSLVIYGNAKDFFLQFPKIKVAALRSCEEIGKSNTLCAAGDENSNLGFIPVKYSNGVFLAVPGMPQQLTIPREPKYAISHYIEWLSAYYSPLINTSEEVRRDVLFEASTVHGLPYGEIERTFAKILLSYEQITNLDYAKNGYQIENSKKRLSTLLRFVKGFKDPELYGIVLNLIAIADIHDAEFRGVSYDVAISRLKAIMGSKNVSSHQKDIASYNLGTIFTQL